jgi:hypothetical protein
VTPIVRGVTLATTPPHTLAELPPEWRSQDRWMAWEPNYSRRTKKHVRALLASDGQPANHSSRGGWTSLQRACWVAYEWEVWRTGGGLAFIHEIEADPQNPHRPNRGTVCFAVASREELRQFMAECGFVPPEVRS